MIRWHYPKQKEVPCKQSKFMELRNKSRDWLSLAKKLSERGPIVLRAGFMLLLLTWKEFLKDIDLADRQQSPMRSEKSSQTYWTAGLWHTDFRQEFGQAPWLPELLKMSFMLNTILLMFRAFFMNWASLFNAPKRNWQKPTKHFNLAGVRYKFPSLKKSQERRGGYPLRGRSQLPARPDALSDMGKDRVSAGNSDDGAEEYAQDIRFRRTLLRKIPLPFSASLQRRNIHIISRKNPTILFSSESIFDPRQCVISQRRRGMEMVFRSPQISCCLQSSRVFPGTQCVGKSMASYSTSWHAQSLFFDSGRIVFNVNFNIPEHSEKSVADTRISASIPVTM